MKRLQGQAGGDGWSGFVLTRLLLETAGLQLFYCSAHSTKVDHYKNYIPMLVCCLSYECTVTKKKNMVVFHLPAFILISLPLHFGQDVIQGPYLRGDSVDLDPDSIRMNPGHSWAGQTLCTRA